MRDTSKIWLIADTHFNHKNIIKYCNRPFSSIEEMNETIIENWNKVVKNSDRVFVLGDFCLAGKDKIIETGSRLNGRKTLILGNHDSASLRVYYEAGFEMVSKHTLFLDGFLLSHYPIPDCRFYNIHGHIHNESIEVIDNLHLNTNSDLYKLYYNVSVDVINFTPISLNEIKRRINNLK